MPGIDPAIPPSTDPNTRLAESIASLTRRVRDLERQFQGSVAGGVPVVAALPTAGRAGRVFMLSSDKKLYRDTGTAWVLNS